MRKTQALQYDKVTFNVVGIFLVTLFAVVCIIPFILIISASFETESEIIKNGYALFPRQFSLEGYQTAFQDGKVILNSCILTIFITVTGVILSVLLTSMTGYVLQRKDFRWRNGFSFYFFFTTLFSGGLLPWYILCVRYLGLKNNILSLILPSLLPVWNILLVKGYMASLPYELVESAKIDGASDFMIYYKIIMPVSKPVIATVALFSAIAYWNDWWYCMLFITKSDKYTLQFLLYKMLSSIEALKQLLQQGSAAVVEAPMQSFKMAMTMLTIGPIVIAYPMAQKYFMKGLVVGAVKG